MKLPEPIPPPPNGCLVKRWRQLIEEQAAKTEEARAWALEMVAAYRGLVDFWRERSCKWQAECRRQTRWLMFSAVLNGALVAAVMLLSLAVKRTP